MDGSISLGIRGSRLRTALEQSGLFDALPAERRDMVLGQFRLRCDTFASGEHLCREGETADSFWLVTNGSVDVRGTTAEGEQYVAERGPGSLIGELAAMRPGSRRSATVLARGHDTEAYRFSMAALGELPCEDRAALWQGLACHVAAKLASTVYLRTEIQSLATAREKLLRRFVNEDVLGSIRSETAETFERREAAIWFSDLAGFSAIAAEAEPEQVAEFLRAAMTIQSDAIEKHGGLVDKFMGDGLMAYWLPHSEGEGERRRVADAAVKAAMEAQQGMALVSSPVAGRQVSLRIGLHIGMVHVGNFGSDHRWAFTLIGRDVNTASRIEAAKPDPGGAEFGPLRVSTDLAVLLGGDHRQALPDRAAVQVKTDHVTFIHRKPE